MSMFDEYESELKKRRMEYFGDTNGNKEANSMDEEIDTESIKDLNAQIDVYEKTLQSNNEQIARFKDDMVKAKEEDRFQDAAIAQNGIEVLSDNNKNIEQSIYDTRTLIEEREAQNEEIIFEHFRKNTPALVSQEVVGDLET